MLETPQLRYTVRPWVKHGLRSPMQMVAHSPGLAKLAPSPTIRHVKFVEGFQTTQLSAPNTRTATPISIDTSSPSLTPSNPSRSSLQRRTRTPNRLGNPLPSSRATGSPYTPDHMRSADADTDAESMLSFTPSMRSKQLANWFSGLLGR